MVVVCRRALFLEACETLQSPLSSTNRLVAAALSDVEQNASGPPLSLTFADHWLQLYEVY